MNHPRDIAIEEFNYPLPDEKIAKYPLANRDASKLLHYHGGNIENTVFKQVPEIIPSDSLLIFNETKVVQARLQFKKTSGAHIEVFILEPYNTDIQSAFQSSEGSMWKCFVGNAKKWKDQNIFLEINDHITLEAQKIKQEGNTFIVSLSWNSEDTFSNILLKAGEIPLPPYLKREAEPDDRKRYQTVFARLDGSVAAPTAGLHFTNEILFQLQQKNIPTAKVTLHVGAGTFKPVDSEAIGDHEMHNEQIVVKTDTLIHLAKHAHKRFTPIGTTSVRTLESIYWYGVMLLEKGDQAVFDIPQWFPYENHNAISKEQSLQAVIAKLQQNNQSQLTGQTRLMIAPGYKYHMVDAMFTNFHQPKSTLLLLVSAFLGEDWKKIYDYALAHNFRFLSYGDSCYFQP